MKLLKGLRTNRRTYKDLIAFDNAQEAKNAGYHMLYYDELTGGTIYGKPLDPAFPKICLVAVVFDTEKCQNL